MENLLSQDEAHFTISTLKTMLPENIGSSEWYDQHAAIEAVAYQANCDAMHNKKESMARLLISLDKVSFLVADLLVSEAWIDHALPHLRQHVAQCKDLVLSYSVISHEALVASLLQTLLHHREMAEALTEEAALELCDWCTRKLVFIHQIDKKKSSSSTGHTFELTATDLSPLEELQGHETESNISAAFSAITILQYLTAHSSTLSLGIMHQIASTNNGAATAVRLLLCAPWERKCSYAVERWDGGEWKKMSPQSMHKMTAIEAQAWMLLYNLLFDPVAFAKLDLDDERLITDLLLVRRILLPHLLDQLPILTDIQRFLDMLALGASKMSLHRHGDERYRAAASASRVVIEQPPKMRTALLSNIDWKQLVEKQQQEHFSFSEESSAATVPERYKRFIENIDYLYQSLDDVRIDDGISSKEQPMMVKFDAFTRSSTVNTEQWVWHGSYRFEIQPDSIPEDIQIPVSDPNKDRNLLCVSISTSNAGDDRPRHHIHGHRFRLTSLIKHTGTSALPSEGKLVCSFADHSIESLFSLPSHAFRNTESLPRACWITAGSLQNDGVVFQLKAKKVVRASERAGPHSEWCFYAPSTGAITRKLEQTDFYFPE